MPVLKCKPIGDYTAGAAAARAAHPTPPQEDTQ